MILSLIIYFGLYFLNSRENFPH